MATSEVSDRIQAEWPGCDLKMGRHSLVTVMSTTALEFTSLQSMGYLVPEHEDNLWYSRRSFTLNVWDLTFSGLTLYPEFRYLNFRRAQ
jgi:hypothetical protein